ncbi:hypothetical protein CLOM_g4918, partial [Closterium sp. NIES-68]
LVRRPTKWASADKAAVGLRQVVQVLARAGHFDHCFDIYRSVREECVRETLKALEVEPIRGTAHLNQLPWQQLQHTMTDWLRDCRLLLRTVMEEEFSLATSIFGILHSTTQHRTASRREPPHTHPHPSQPPSFSSTTATATASTAFSNPRLPSGRSASTRSTAGRSVRSGSTRALRLGDEAAADSGRAISLKILRQAGMPRTLSTLMHNANTITAAQPTPERVFLLLDMEAVVQELMPQVERLVCWSDSEGLLAEWRGLTRGIARAVLGTFDALTATLQVPVEQPRKNKWRLFRGEGSSSSRESGGSGGYPPGWGVEKSGGVHPVTSYVVNYIATYLGRSATSSRAYGYGTMLEKLLETHGQGRTMEEETMKVISALVRNMEARAATCNNPLLKSLFLVNNILYIGRLSEKIHLPLEHQQLLEAQSKAFREAGLQKVAASLGPRGRSAAMEPNEVNRRLHRFNIAFEDLALEQKDWVICDGAWRKTTVQEWAAHLKQIYEEFLEPHSEYMSTLSSYHWEADAMERLVLKSFFATSR